MAETARPPTAGIGSVREAAWQEAEAAMPEGWTLRTFWLPHGKNQATVYAGAEHYGYAHYGLTTIIATGDTIEEALRELVAKFRV